MVEPPKVYFGVESGEAKEQPWCRLFRIVTARMRVVNFMGFLKVFLEVVGEVQSYLTYPW